MNERIRQLAEQATKKYDRLGNEIPFAQPDLEKFAELVVREVLAVQEQFIAEGHNAWHLNKPTKNHFGISE